jgi:hypothetical protein
MDDMNMQDEQMYTHADGSMHIHPDGTPCSDACMTRVAEMHGDDMMPPAM